MARWCRSGLSVSGPFVCRCLIIRTVLRFHIPLIEPDSALFHASGSRRKHHEFAHEKLASAVRAGPGHSCRTDIRSGKRWSLAANFVLAAQPLTQPSAGMLFDCPIGFADRTKTEVVRPSDHHPVELSSPPVPVIQLGLVRPVSLLIASTDANHPLLRRHRAQIGPSRLSASKHRPNVYPRKSNFSSGSFADPRLGLVHRQLQLRHHHPHRGQSFFRPAPTADHQIIGIVNDCRSKTLLVPQLLPSKHEPAHVEIAEQRADRRTLRSPSTLIPITRIPMLLSSLVRFLDRRRQPHLDQMKHGAVDNPASHRL